MPKIYRSNLTKKDISNKIHSNIGLSNTYTKIIAEDLILILKNLIKTGKLNILNFGTFKSIKKKARLGRNPKNKKTYKIYARKTITFTASKKLIKKINSFNE